MAMADRRPDILLILTDQWNARMVGYAGDAAVQTPHLDGLAAAGVTFSAAYTRSPVCMAARCSLASGLYPHNHGFWNNFTDVRFPARQITFFRDLQRAGYRTARIGKYHYFNLAWGEDHRDHSAYYAELGLDWAQELPTPYMGPYLRNEYTAHLQARGLFDAYATDIAERFATGDFDIVRPSPLPPDDHLDGYVAQQALAYLDRCPPNQPLFLCVSFPGPHTPFDAPSPYGERFAPAAMQSCAQRAGDGAPARARRTGSGVHAGAYSAAAGQLLRQAGALGRPHRRTEPGAETTRLSGKHIGNLCRRPWRVLGQPRSLCQGWLPRGVGAYPAAAALAAGADRPHAELRRR